jgi:hypothetical protein
VVAVRVVQVTVDQVVGMVAVRNRLVTTLGTVPVSIGVPAAVVVRSASPRVERAHWDPMFVHVATVGVMQVTVVQIIRVIFVLHRGVSARGSVHVGVPLVCLVSHLFPLM